MVLFLCPPEPIYILYHCCVNLVFLKMPLAYYIYETKKLISLFILILPSRKGFSLF